MFTHPVSAVISKIPLSLHTSSCTCSVASGQRSIGKPTPSGQHSSRGSRIENCFLGTQLQRTWTCSGRRPFSRQLSIGYPIIAATAVSNGSLSTEVISNFATLAFKAVLKEHETAEVRVVSENIFSLLAGRIDSIVISGTGWVTPFGLTCRSINVKTEPLQIDIGAALQGRLQLVTAANAFSTLVVGGADFDNFLQSFLFREKVQSLSAGGKKLTKLRVEGVKDDELLMSCQCDSVRYSFAVKPDAQSKASVRCLGAVPLPLPPKRGTAAAPAPARIAKDTKTATKIEDDAVAERRALEASAARSGSEPGSEPGIEAAELAAVQRELERFWNAVTLDLDGIEIRLEKLKIADGRIRIEGRGRVWKFPSDALKF